MAKQVERDIPQHLIRRRKMLRFVQLETTDGGELLEAMIQAVGITEASRRLCRDPRTIASYRQRKRVPYPIWEWLILAAANISNSREQTLDAVRWHYPKRRNNRERVMRQRRDRRTLARAVAQERIDQDWRDTLAEPLDPYA